MATHVPAGQSQRCQELFRKTGRKGIIWIRVRRVGDTPKQILPPMLSKWNCKSDLHIEPLGISQARFFGDWHHGYRPEHHHKPDVITHCHYCKLHFSKNWNSQAPWDHNCFCPENFKWLQSSAFRKLNWSHMPKLFPSGIQQLVLLKGKNWQNCQHGSSTSLFSLG